MQPHRAMRLREGYRSTPAQKKLRAFGCWVQAPLKGWNERGNMWPLFFLAKKALSSTKIRLHCASKAAKIPKHQNKQHTMQKYNRKCSCIVMVCSAASAVSLVAAFSHLFTYLHSPFPFEVASHLPPFRHDSVDREHFRPVDHIKKFLKQPM